MRHKHYNLVRKNDTLWHYTNGLNYIATEYSIVKHFVAALTGGGAVGYCDFVDRSTVTAARAKPPTAKPAVSGAT